MYAFLYSKLINGQQLRDWKHCVTTPRFQVNQSMNSITQKFTGIS